MGKKNLRKLNIGEIAYLWRITTIDPQYVLLKVWLVSRQYRNAALLVRLRFDDVWLNYGLFLVASQTEEGRKRIREVMVMRPITPKMVRKIIVAAKDRNWRPKTEHGYTHFEWIDGTGLVSATDATVRGDNPFPKA